MNTLKESKIEEKSKAASSKTSEAEAPEIKPAPRLTTGHDIDDPEQTREDVRSKFQMDIKHSDALKVPQA